MDKKPREIPFKNGFLNVLREQAQPIDPQELAEIRRLAELNRTQEPERARTRLSGRDLSRITVELK